VIALLAGALGAFATRLEPTATHPAPTAPGAAEPAPAGSASEKQLVRLEISAEPAEAELSLDGAKLDGNPFGGSLPRDGAVHRLEAQADGHVPEARMIHLDQDVKLRLTLAPIRYLKHTAPLRPVAPGGAASATPPKSSPHRDAGSSPEGDFVHRTDGKALRPIDNADPYGP
jgi:hypothetical protein